MAFHVEIRRSLRHARIFNVDAGELRGRVLEPWARGGPVELGGNEWDPRESTLTVLEGPVLPAPDLAHGQGWHRARRSACDVTADVLGASATAAFVAVLAETPAAQRLAAAALTELALEAVDWRAARARLLAADRVADQLAAAILVLDPQVTGGSWLVDAGLAVGAFGGRAVVAYVGRPPLPPELRELDALVLDPESPDAGHVLAERARRALAATGRRNRDPAATPTPRSGPAPGS